MAEALGADGAGVWPLSCVDAEVSLEVFHAVELSVAFHAAEGTAARWVKLQPGSLASCSRLLETLLVPQLALAVVLSQQAGQVESQTTVLTGIQVDEVTAGSIPDYINL